MPSRKTLRLGSLLALVAGAGLAMPFLVGEAKEALMERAMTRGGYVIYLRHASRLSGPREPFSANTPLAAFSDCGKQRNLSAAGFSVNWPVRHFRNRFLSSPKATLFISSRA